ncbi:MAG: response regulator [Ruminiclostridium sp.]|nr:response regulator [Ruminiclostridium sp.]
MLKNVMIISTSESFAIKSMEQKLIAVEISAYQVVARTTEIGSNIDRAGLIVLYLDERMAAMTASLQNMLSYLNDKLYESNKMLIIIAKRKDYEIAMRYISEDFILQFFDRPMNMEAFVQTIFEYMNDGERNIEDVGGKKKEAEDTESADGENAPVKRRMTADMVAVRKRRILLVDDDASYLRIIRNWLKDGYDVGVASSALQAIMWLAKNDVDLILLDYKMPVCSGAQMFAMLQNDSQTKTIPVFFLTGNSARDDVMEILKLNPEGYLLKTFDRKALLTRLEEFFEFR